MPSPVPVHSRSCAAAVSTHQRPRRVWAALGFSLAMLASVVALWPRGASAADLPTRSSPSERIRSERDAVRAAPRPARLPEDLRPAERTIRREDIKADVFTLAADALEGREAGTRGGWAAAAYIVRRLRQADVRPAGVEGDFFQEFGDAYRNILAVVPGRHPQLRGEYVLIGAHYDHVGYGNERNSRGPIGYVHNGADDNASGTSALLEIAEAVARAPRRPRRSVLIAFWDAEEKGLLGSRFFVRSPTVPLQSIRFVLNVDMVGRLRKRTVEVFGWRTAADLRRLAATANADGLKLTFPLTILPDSDHYPFFEQGIPYLLLHTGKHPEYHTPADDPMLIDFAGTETVTRLLFRLAWSLADGPKVPAFREAAWAEARADRVSTRRPVWPQRLGISWNADRGAEGEFIITAVEDDSPAARAGVMVGDRLTRFDGVIPRDSEHLIALVRAADADATVTIRRGSETERTLSVVLAGTPDRLGVRVAFDPADENAVLVDEVLPGGLAQRVGVRPGDRLLLEDAEASRPLSERARAFLARRHRALLVEREGRILSLAVRQ